MRQEWEDSASMQAIHRKILAEFVREPFAATEVNMNNIRNMADFHRAIVALKKLPRSGWLLKGIPGEACESVADHSFATAMMAWMIAREYFPQLDDIKVLQMAMIHELGEIGAGDITPYDGVTPAQKHEMEKESVQKVLSHLERRDDLYDLWMEFETGETAEAIFVRRIDKLEMGLQALVYQLDHGMDPADFLTSAKQDDEILQAILEV